MIDGFIYLFLIGLLLIVGAIFQLVKWLINVAIGNKRNINVSRETKGKDNDK